jgi:ABC-type bacteriocin/lantibiotic exporter with double-glycine peptidase domain
MDLKTIKQSVDAVANIVKAIEELEPTAKVLPNIERSLQLDWYSCGAQSVFMILRFFGKRCSVERVKNQLQTDWSGTGLPDIKRLFRKYGLYYQVIAKARISDLRHAIDSGLPALISTLDGGHWSVVYGYSQSHVYVCDPSLMINAFCRVPIKRFKSQWDNWAMIIND